MVESKGYMVEGIGYRIYDICRVYGIGYRV